MTLDTFAKKSTLAILIAYVSVAWLNKWHQYGFSRSPISFPPVSNWLRDSLIVLIPVMLAIWIGIPLTRWLIEHSNGRTSPSTQSILAAVILAGVTTSAIILIEGNKVFRTGIGNEFVFLASICSRLYPNGNLTLNILQWAFPSPRALRFHILLQDGFNLMLVNLTITILLIIALEGYERIRNSYAHETRELAPVMQGQSDQL